MRNIALDLGRKGITVSESKDGKIIQRWKVRSLEELEEEVLAPGTPPARVAFEACREGWHVHDWIKARGHVPVMADTTRVRTIVGIGHHGRKNDRIDADKLAVALDKGLLPEAHVLSPEQRALREELGIRESLLCTRGQYVTTLRGLARGRGIDLPGCSPCNFVHHYTRSTTISEDFRAVLAPLMSSVESLDEQVAVMETRLHDKMAKDKVVQLLSTAPGVSLITACAFKAAVDQPWRFPTAHAVESYLGLCPREETTGGGPKQRLGGITKAGNAYARTCLVESAQSILRSRSTDGLSNWGREVSRRRGPMVAAVAVARRLAGVMWAMWRDDRPYLDCAPKAGTAVDETVRTAALAHATAKLNKRHRAALGVRRRKCKNSTPSKANAPSCPSVAEMRP